jgi:caa(3)-type oxidase subunit IV
MSEQSGSGLETAGGAPAAAAGVHKQPLYVIVFGVLALLTLVEILVAASPLPRLPILLPLALVKAGLVVLFYMHIKFDHRVFSVLFLLGLLLGSLLIIALIVLFGGPATGGHGM